MIIKEDNPSSQDNLKNKSQLQPNLQGSEQIRQTRRVSPDPEFDYSQSDMGGERKKVKKIKLQEGFFIDEIDVMDKMENKRLQMNTFIFGILLILTQIAVGLVYGFKFNVVSIDETWLSLNQVTFEPIALTVLTLFAALLGFPMLFAYHKKLIWTALSFNLFILALTLQLYFIANNLINRIGINPTLQKFSQDWHIYIWNFDYHYLPSNTYTGTYYQAFGNTLIDGIKCAISNMIIYSSVLGRVGILQVFIITIIGTIGYQFSRQILFSLGIDFGDGCSMWIYGGFAGFIIGLIQFFKNRNNKARSTKQSQLYTGSFYSTGFSMIGSTVLVIVIPILCIHAPRKIFQKYPNLLATIPFTVYHSIIASIIASVGTSICINGKVVVRDFINGAIAGGITGLNASLFIKIPAYAQVIGFTAGLLQSLAQNFVQKTIAMKHDLFHSYSFTLFGIQGLVGAAFGSIFQLSSDFPTQTIVLGCIAAGLGIGFGLAIQLFVFFIGCHGNWDNFHDKVYMADVIVEPFKEQQSVLFHQRLKQNQFAPIFMPFE